jgi:3-isopropylmalate dehydrogenase
VHTSVYEPIHGSYPQAAGRNIANPLATILSAAMLLDGLNLTVEAQEVRDAVAHSMEEGIVTEDIAEGKAYSTSEVGDWIASTIADR